MAEAARVGAHLANGSDFPVEEPNPLFGFYAAITRQDPGHARRGLDARSAPDAGRGAPPPPPAPPTPRTWRRGADARSRHARHLLILSHDIMQVPPRDILTTTVVVTVSGGQVTHDTLTAAPTPAR